MVKAPPKLKHFSWRMLSGAVAVCQHTRRVVQLLKLYVMCFSPVKKAKQAWELSNVPVWLHHILFDRSSSSLTFWSGLSLFWWCLSRKLIPCYLIHNAYWLVVSFNFSVFFYRLMLSPLWSQQTYCQDWFSVTKKNKKFVAWFSRFPSNWPTLQNQSNQTIWLH